MSVQTSISASLQKPFVRYLIVGGSAFLAEFLSFILFYYVLNIPLVLSNALSFGCGFVTNFTLNRQWTFGHEHIHRARKQVILFTAAALLNLALTIALVSYLKSIGIKPGIGKPVAMILTSLWNFVIYQKIIFKQLDKS